MTAAADTSHLSVAVVNSETGRTVAAFMLTTDAQKFVEFMAQRTGRADQYVLTDLPETAGAAA